MKTITLGKFKGLSQVSTNLGVFSILAIDHRNNLRKAINPTNPSLVPDKDLFRIKRSIVKYISPYSSAVLLDPEIGAMQYIINKSLIGDKGLICAIEKSGYFGDRYARRSEILPGWGVPQAKQLGSSAIKLLVYFHPKSDTVSETKDLIQIIADECNRYDIPFFLEVLSYSIDMDYKELGHLERCDVVLESARKLSHLGIDVLKTEFPIDFKYSKDENLWYEACAELSQASSVPWVLLSASVEFETYLRQVEIACSAGASGIAAGRAIWQESVGLRGIERRKFLTTIACQRMKQLTDVCNNNAKPWFGFVSLPN